MGQDGLQDGKVFLNPFQEGNRFYIHVVCASHRLWHISLYEGASVIFEEYGSIGLVKVKIIQYKIIFPASHAVVNLALVELWAMVSWNFIL